MGFKLQNPLRNGFFCRRGQDLILFKGLLAALMAIESMANVTILLGWRLVVQQVTNYLYEDLELLL